jgi:predicted O-methyltransferase YrrM
MGVEKTSPLRLFFLSILVFMKALIQFCFCKRKPLLFFVWSILDSDCQKVSSYVRHVNLIDLFPSAEVPKTIVYSPLQRGMGLTYNEIINLCALTQILAPRVIFEIGTFRGGTTRALARHASAESKIYTLDLPPEQYGQSNLKQHDSDIINVLLNPDHKPQIGDLYLQDPTASSRINQLLGSSDTFDYAPFHGQVDLFFIDGAHSYDFIASDTGNALNCLSEKGVVVWHDFKGGFRGILRFFREFSLTHELYHIIDTSLVLYCPRGMATLTN